MLFSFIWVFSPTVFSTFLFCGFSHGCLKTPKIKTCPCICFSFYIQLNLFLVKYVQFLNCQHLIFQPCSFHISLMNLLPFLDVMLTSIIFANCLWYLPLYKCVGVRKKLWYNAVDCCSQVYAWIYKNCVPKHSVCMYQDGQFWQICQAI